MSQVILDLQLACKKNDKIPKKDQFQTWVNSIVLRFNRKSAITIRLVDEEEIHKLNYIFCKKDKPTNVLAFLCEKPRNINVSLLFLGDLVICQPIILQEAKQYQKSLDARLAHMVIHGSLHLLGFNHKKTHEKKIMESFEISTMLSLGYDNPYYF